ncbi:1-deoxy-D-xylulose-5-phosphate synthase [Helicobacter sp.]|uniref:1-deoxy-D-xylulose-5-phosphate synthase n=1 Tax=Helicobacter sp. TaxID=218 RepID=UPI0025BE47D6|nr:1-deoxy-D-xylulose-5-phosphate synthase [Helicobacter sp.]MCI5968932.1 1-deoxy-D-xylulose-5-phosphate synthase [Helicobacter sp.]MDY2584322.1 1-deoxy-D-xylulose-5-phosphate synthase [Helicobacter sp.]
MPLDPKYLEILNKNTLSEKDFATLNTLAQLVRERILEVVSKNGGHLSSTLGAVELIIGMHYVFDSPNDPFIFDVSHQAYAHKLLTGRWDSFETLRQSDGISGFTRPSESVQDYFIAGHSSTSISLGVGAAKAFSLKGSNHTPVALIGDGAMSAGLVYEALNELGDRKYPMVIILNDNEMSIAEPIGAISKYLSQIIAGKFVQGIKNKIGNAINNMPNATYIVKRFEESLKLITPGILFEELGLEYIGPIDGHNLKEIINTLILAKSTKKPVVVHAQTLKGKGYTPAEGHLEQWHGVSPFDPQKKSLAKSSVESPTSIFAQTLLELADKDSSIVGITAAMPSGTGLDKLIKAYPNRFWDVAIAEQHATTQASALAKEGFKPFVAIYSTFLQRAFDQLIHDVGIMKTPVKFAIDRAGIVGEDGETHQGAFDIGYLNLIPNFTLFAPRDLATLALAVKFARDFSSGPCAFRYPRKAFLLKEEIFHSTPFEYGKLEILKECKSEILLLGYGNGVGRAYKCLLELEKQGINASLVDLRFAKPLDKNALISLAKTHKKWFIFSDSAKIGGIGQILSAFVQENTLGIQICSLEFEDAFIPHGKVEVIETKLGLDTQSLVTKITKHL